MRPEAVAFRELDTLVKNLTEQLAGYRRRALAGEARARGLEVQVAELTETVKAVRDELEASRQATPPSAEVLAENERLRSRVAEAKVRTTQIADRVRFLRQQVAQGVEK